MTTISTVGSLSPDLAQAIFKAVDSNNDQQISLSEFTGFLSRLAGDLTGGGEDVEDPALSKPVSGPGVTAPLVSSLARSAEIAGVARAGGAGAAYAEIPGFDFRKLTDTTHVNEKYTPAVRVFSQAIAAGNLPPLSSSLPAIVEYAKANGFPDAKVVKEDCIDFGDTHGAIDVITTVGRADAHWWFNNT